MGACEATPATHSHNRGKDRAKRPRQPRTTQQKGSGSSLPIVGRRLAASSSFVLARLPARRCGRSSLTPARTTAQTGSDEETRQQQSHQPGGQRTKATRLT